MKRKVLFSLLILLGAWSLSAQKVTSKTALNAYINNNDQSFTWEVVDSTKGNGFTGYQLRLVSQTWRNIPWIHELAIIVPDVLKHDEALLHITGGAIDPETNKLDFHKWNDMMLGFQSDIAVKCQAVTAVLWQVPRQPLFGGKKEDELISYTYHQFQQDKDYTWPLLLPMAKSAIRAMDAIEQFVPTRKAGSKVNKFVPNGASKRGWTTWMAAATGDKRIIAIAPMVIDILNMPVNIPYQIDMFGGYSIQIQDYVNLGLTETFSNPEGKELVDMIDPYSYREKFTMPKMIFMGTNDEYWTVDAIKNYINDIPGKNFISYVPNEGHSMGDKKMAINALGAFFHQTINGKSYPSCDYKLEEKNGKIEISIKADAKLLQDVVVWEANSENKDFRERLFVFDNKKISNQKNIKVSVDYPQKGYKAFFVMLKYTQPMGGMPYNVCTRMYMADTKQVFVKPFVPEQK